MRKILYTVLLSFVLGFPFTVLQAQNNRKMDHERLVNDLRIMEGILEKLLTPTENAVFSSGSGSQGFYLPDYGVIFIVPTSSPLKKSYFILPRAPRAIPVPRASGEDDDENGYANRLTLGFGNSDDDDARAKRLEENEKKELERISSKVSDFLGIYADAIGQLSRQDKIAVYLYNSSNQSPEHLFYVLKKDIIEFKSRKIKSKTFNKRIKYSSLLKNDEMSSQIDIMAYIFNTSLEAPTSGSYNFRMIRTGVNGLYLDGFGALFIVNRRKNSLRNNFLAIDSQLDYVSGELESFYSDNENGSLKKSDKVKLSERKKEKISSRKRAFDNEMVEYRKSMEEYKLSFSTLLGNYGHTLRLVDNNEWIGVITNWQNSIRRGSNLGRSNALIIKVLKKDVDTYNTGRISKEEFFKKIGYTEY